MVAFKVKIAGSVPVLITVMFYMVLYQSNPGFSNLLLFMGGIISVWCFVMFWAFDMQRKESVNNETTESIHQLKLEKKKKLEEEKLQRELQKEERNKKTIKRHTKLQEMKLQSQWREFKNKREIS